jgi:hypothetical protein
MGPFFFKVGVASYLDVKYIKCAGAPHGYANDMLSFRTLTSNNIGDGTNQILNSDIGC